MKISPFVQERPFLRGEKRLWSQRIHALDAAVLAFLLGAVLTFLVMTTWYKYHPPPDCITTVQLAAPSWQRFKIFGAFKRYHPEDEWWDNVVDVFHDDKEPPGDKDGMVVRVFHVSEKCDYIGIMALNGYPGGGDKRAQDRKISLRTEGQNSLGVENSNLQAHGEGSDE